LILAYGTARVLSLAFSELRDAIFAKVAQHAMRQNALATFQHLHRLSLRFHLERQTGGLSRAIERGVDFRAARVAELMTREPRRIAPERLAIDCVEAMERAPKVTQLLVVDAEGRLAGALHLHDLFRARVI